MKCGLSRRPQRWPRPNLFPLPFLIVHAASTLARTACTTGGYAQGDGSTARGPSFHRRDGSSVYFVCTVYPYTSAVKKNTNYYPFHSSRAPYTHLSSCLIATTEHLCGLSDSISFPNHSLYDIHTLLRSQFMIIVFHAIIPKVSARANCGQHGVYPFGDFR